MSPDSEREPTSSCLFHLLDDTRESSVPVTWIIEQLGDRSFEFTLFVMAVLALVPGGSTIIGVLIAWPALQLVFGRVTPLLPGVLARRAVPAPKLSRLIDFLAPRLRWIENLVKPRWLPGFEALRRTAGLLVLLLGIALVLPLPFSHVLPALTIMLISIAFLEDDGILLLLSLLLGLGSLAFTGAQVWAAVEFVNWFDQVLG